PAGPRLGREAERGTAARSLPESVSQPGAGAAGRPGGAGDRRRTPGIHDGQFRGEAAVLPGGDIGSLAVHGTINDLAMGGAEPLFLSAAFILEEGLETETLARVAESMARAAQAAGV